ncbi:amidase [Gloeocapsopsis sp. AAB1 = 1H9]|uniref:Amidase n=1 Tax=Gloeocapsopsis dulcis AAB1 = 1H9 TaxID=1433147 RepID=A0A6N8FUG6_9CHRO|nr:amidase [Gloeocapsopsis dulcis AAB1 = 1H9]
MQIVSQQWCEIKLLAIAKHLHQVIGVFQHPPGY